MPVKKYIHYGHTKFEKDMFCPISNRELFTKPNGGLWASPVDAKFGWKDWCNAEKFRKCKKSNSFTFTLRGNAVVEHIRSVSDLDALPKVKSTYELWCQLDFERLLEIGIDAIELHMSEEVFIDGLYPMNTLYHQLYGWDCDSILIMNPDVVVEVE